MGEKIQVPLLNSITILNHWAVGELSARVIKRRLDIRVFETYKSTLRYLGYHVSVHYNYELN